MSEDVDTMAWKQKSSGRLPSRSKPRDTKTTTELLFCPCSGCTKAELDLSGQVDILHNAHINGQSMSKFKAKMQTKLCWGCRSSLISADFIGVWISSQKRGPISQGKHGHDFSGTQPLTGKWQLDSEWCFQFVKRFQSTPQRIISLMIQCIYPLRTLCLNSSGLFPYSWYLLMTKTWKPKNYLDTHCI